MEESHFASNGEKPLPPGFRFQPTDEEIVFQYLAPKTFSHPLPPHLIPHVTNIFTFHPLELLGNKAHDKYFFSNKESNNDGEKTRPGLRACCTGHWKATGSTKRITCSKRMPIVGIRKTLVFEQGNKRARQFPTDWVMHEYCIALSEDSDCNNNNNVRQVNRSQGSLVRIGNWSLCRIFLKKRSDATEVDDDCDYKPRDCSVPSDADSSSASSSSPHFDSSVFAEVSSTMAKGRF